MTPQAQPTIIVEKFFHREYPCLALKFDYNEDLIRICKLILARWSQTHRCWYVREGDVPLNQLFAWFKGKAWVDAAALYGGKAPNFAPQSVSINKPSSEPQISVPAAYKSLLIQRRYSESTVRTYISFFKKFMRYFFPKDLQDITEDDIKKYLLELVEKQKVSYSTQNQAINAIKFYYEQVLEQNKGDYWIDRPKKEKKLPEVLSKEEVLRILQSAGNLKHQTIIALLYSAGLRRSELLNLRVRDVDFDRKQIWIRGGKGKKDRITLLSSSLHKSFKAYLNQYKPNYWFIEGSKRKKYSASSVAAVVKKAAVAAQIRKNVTPHMFRHSFATHLMDNGVDTRIIQKLLGHSSIQTTAIYTHVSQNDLQKIISPIDHLISPN